MAEPTLMFCVGATKAGTSWLHRYLAGHPQCHFRSIKELHYFDALDFGRVAAEVQGHRKALAGLTEQALSAGAAKRDVLKGEIADRLDWIEVLERGQEDGGAYMGYLSAGRGEARLVGDVTPAYALLSVERLRAMAALVPDTRFLYLLRDPVERLWSHVRMIARRRARGAKVTAARCARILERVLAGEESEIVVRSDYAGALARLNDALDPRRLMVMFYEDMFRPGGVARITGFLGLVPWEANVAARAHAGPALALAEPQRERARDWLAPQYDEVAARLGRVPEEWQANMVRM